MRFSIGSLMSLPDTTEFYIEYNSGGEEVAIVYKTKDGKYKKWNIRPTSGDTTATSYVKISSGAITDTYTPPT